MQTGYSCLATESSRGVIHVCHARDEDIDGFIGQPVIYRWQLIKMPTALLIRLELAIIDRPENPFRFELFLNVAAEDQAQVLADLANLVIDQLSPQVHSGNTYRHRLGRLVFIS